MYTCVYTQHTRVLVQEVTKRYCASLTTFSIWKKMRLAFKRHLIIVIYHCRVFIATEVVIFPCTNACEPEAITNSVHVRSRCVVPMFHYLLSRSNRKQWNNTGSDFSIPAPSSNFMLLSSPLSPPLSSGEPRFLMNIFQTLISSKYLFLKKKKKWEEGKEKETEKARKNSTKTSYNSLFTFPLQRKKEIHLPPKQKNEKERGCSSSATTRYHCSPKS